MIEHLRHFAPVVVRARHRLAVYLDTACVAFAPDLGADRDRIVDHATEARRNHRPGVGAAFSSSQACFSTSCRSLL